MAMSADIIACIQEYKTTEQVFFAPSESCVFGEPTARYCYDVFYIQSRVKCTFFSNELSWTSVPEFTKEDSPYGFLHQMVAMYRLDNQALFHPEFMIVYKGVPFVILDTGFMNHLCDLVSEGEDFDLYNNFSVFIFEYLNTIMTFHRHNTAIVQFATRKLQQLASIETVSLELRKKLTLVEEENSVLRETTESIAQLKHELEEARRNALTLEVPDAPAGDDARFITVPMNLHAITPELIDRHKYHMKQLTELDFATRTPEAVIYLDMYFIHPTTNRMMRFAGNDMNQVKNRRMEFVPHPSSKAVFTIDRVNAHSVIVIGPSGNHLRIAEMVSGVRCVQFNNKRCTLDIHLGDHPIYQARGMEAVRAAVQHMQRVINEEVPRYIESLQQRVNSYQNHHNIAIYRQFVQSMRVDTSRVVIDDDDVPITHKGVILEPKNKVATVSTAFVPVEDQE
jgi:hypothetical protein